MLRIHIYKGDRPSEGANNLRTRLTEMGHKTLVLKAEGSVYRGGADRLLINWGSSSVEAQRLSNMSGHVLNRRGAIQVASNKLACLHALEELNISHVPFFTDHHAAHNFLTQGRSRLYARTKLTGSSGEGIVLIMREDDPQNNQVARRGFNYPIATVTAAGAPIDGASADVLRRTANCQLFTVGHIGSRVEWRVHVFRDAAILTQKKLRRAGGDGEASANPNTLVRNLDSGWIYSVNFQRDPEDAMEQVQATAIAAVEACGLDFGAVDIIVDNKTHTPRVLEINTAPGLDDEGSALTAYATAFAGYATNN